MGPRSPGPRKQDPPAECPPSRWLGQRGDLDREPRDIFPFRPVWICLHWLLHKEAAAHLALRVTLGASVPLVPHPPS